MSDPSTLAGPGWLHAGYLQIRLGLALAEGMDLKSAAKKAGAHIEVVSIAKRMVAFAKLAHIEAPMAAVVAAVLDGTLLPEDAIGALMARRVGPE